MSAKIMQDPTATNRDHGLDDATHLQEHNVVEGLISQIQQDFEDAVMNLPLQDVGLPSGKEWCASTELGDNDHRLYLCQQDDRLIAVSEEDLINREELDRRRLRMRELPDAITPTSDLRHQIALLGYPFGSREVVCIFEPRTKEDGRKLWQVYNATGVQTLKRVEDSQAVFLGVDNPGETIYFSFDELASAQTSANLQAARTTQQALHEVGVQSSTLTTNSGKDIGQMEALVSAKLDTLGAVSEPEVEVEALISESVAAQAQVTSVGLSPHELATVVAEETTVVSLENSGLSIPASESIETEMATNALGALRLCESSLTEQGLGKHLNIPSEVTLRDYLRLIGPIGLNIDYALTLKDALSFVIGPQNPLDSLTELSYTNMLLEALVNLDSSSVTYVWTEWGCELQGAVVRMNLEGAEVFLLGEDALKVAESTICLSRDIKESAVNVITSVLPVVGDITNQMKVPTTESFRIPLRPNLRSYLTKLGANQDMLANTNLARLLRVIFGDTEKTLQVIEAIPTKLLEAGVAVLKPDLNLSTVLLEEIPFREPVLRNVKISCLLEGLKPEVDIAGLQIRVEEISLQLENVKRQAERVVLTGCASLGFDSSGARLTMKCLLNGGKSELVFTASQNEDVKCVVGSLGLDYEALGGLEVPSPQPRASEDRQPTSIDILAATEVGFSICQPVKHASIYFLSSVFFDVVLEDWKDYLPASLKLESVKGLKTSVVVLNPTQETRAVKAEVSCSFRIPVSAPEKWIDLLFCAETSSDRIEHDYRISLSCPSGASIQDIYSAVGLDIGLSLLPKIPLLGDLTESVRVERLSATVEAVDGGPAFKYWSVIISIDRLPLTAGYLTLERTKITFEDLCDNIVDGFGTGELVVSGMNKRLSIDYRTPQLLKPTDLEVKDPGGLSVAGLLEVFKISLRGLPIVEDYLSTELRSFKVSVGYRPDAIFDELSALGEVPEAPTELKTLSIFGLIAEFCLESFNFGPLELRNLLVSVRWHSEHDPDSRGKDYIVFSANATVLDGLLDAEISYNSLDHELSAIIQPTGSVPLGSLLEMFLPEYLKGSGLLSIVGELELESASVAIDAVDKQPKALELRPRRTEQLSLQSEQAPFSVGELVVTCKSGKPGREKNERVVSEGAVGSTEQRQLDGSLESAMNGVEPRAGDVARKVNGMTQEPASFSPPSNQTRTNLSEETGIEVRGKEHLENSGLLVAGTVVQNNLKAQVEFFCRPDGAGTGVGVRVTPASQGALSLENFLILFSLAKPQYEKPNSSPGFLDLEIIEAYGEIEIKDGPANQSPLQGDRPVEAGGKPSDQGHGGIASSSFLAETSQKTITISTLSVTVVSPTPVVILETPAIILEELYLKVQYSAGTQAPTGTSALVYGGMAIANLRLEAVYQKDPKFGSVFMGKLTPKEGEELEFSHLTRSLLGSSILEETGSPIDQDLRLPAEVPLTCVDFVFKHGEFIQVSASGREVWKGNFAGLSLEIGALGGFLQVTQRGGNIQHEVHISGELCFGNFAGVRATLDISPQKNKILTANLTANGTADVSSYASGLIGSEGGHWSALVPKTSDLCFDGSVALFIDFTSSRLLISGEVKNTGSAVLLRMKHPENQDTHAFFFWLEATDILRIWPELKEYVADCFAITRVEMQVLTHETTSRALQQNLSEALEGTRNVHHGIGENTTVELEEERQGSKRLGSTEEQDPTPQEPLKTPMTNALPEDQKLTPGAWFFAEISLTGNHPMSSALALAVHDNERNSAAIMLYALVAKDPRLTTYQISVQDLTLLGGAVVSGCGTYKPGDGSPQSQQIDITGKLSLSQLSKPLVFDIDFRANTEKTWFSTRVEANSAPSISEPFEDMFNVELVNLSIRGEISKNKNTFVISGQVKLGKGAVESHLTGEVLLEDFKPQGVLLRCETADGAALSVRDLYSKLLTPGGRNPTSWPDTYPNFKFEFPSIYYVPGTTDITHENETLYAGYNLVATISLFNKPFDLRMNIATRGVKFVALCKSEIDLGFAKLNGYKPEGAGEAEPGPSIVVDAGTQGGLVLEVRGGLSFFGSDPCNLLLQYKASDQALCGKMELPMGFMGADKPTIGFVYKNGRFGFQGWSVRDPMDKVTEINDLMKRGSKQVKGCDCPELSGLAWKQPVKTMFKFEIGLPEEDDAARHSRDTPTGSIMGDYQSVLRNGKLELQIKWGYDVVVGGNTVVQVSLSPINIQIDPQTDSKTLLGKLAENVTKNLDKVAAQLFAHPEDLVKLAGLLALDKCPKEAVKSLVCRGVNRPDVVESSEKKAKEEITKFLKATSVAESAAGAALGTASTALGVATTGAVVGTIVSAITAGVAIAEAQTLLSSAVAVPTGFLTFLPMVLRFSRSEKKKEIEDTVDEAKRKHIEIQVLIDRATKTLKDSMVVAKKPSLTFIADRPDLTTVVCNWGDAIPECLSSANSPQDVTWVVNFSTTPDFKKVDKEEITKATSCTFNNNHWPHEPKFYARIRPSITVNGTGYEASAWSPTTTLEHIPYLRAPSCVTFSPVRDVGMLAVDGPAEALSIKIRSRENSTIVFQDTYRPGKGSDRFSSQIRLIAPPGFPTHVDTLLATAQNISADTQKFRHSAITDSKPFQITEHVADLKAELQRAEIKVYWTPRTLASKPGQQAYFVTKDFKFIPPLSARLVDAPPLRQLFLTAPDGIEYGEDISVAVHNPDSENGSIPIFSVAPLIINNHPLPVTPQPVGHLPATPQPVDHLPTVTVDGKQSFVDVEKKELVLSVTTAFKWPNDEQQYHLFACLKYPDNSSEDKEVIRVNRSLLIVRGVDVGRFEGAVGISIVTQDTANRLSRAGPEWSVTVRPANLVRPKLTARISSSGALKVKWDELEGMDCMRVTAGETVNEVPQAQRKAAFAHGEVPRFRPGGTYAITARGSVEGVLGAQTTVEVRAPAKLIKQKSSESTISPLGSPRSGEGSIYNMLGRRWS